MAELEPWMAAQGIFLDSTGMPTLPDGTPALPQNRPQEERPQPPDTIFKAMQQQAFAANKALEEGEPPPQEMEMINGFPFPKDDPLGYGFGPFYTPSKQDYPADRTPLAPPLWSGENLGPNGEPGAPMPEGALNWNAPVGQPGNWTDFYTPDDRSSGGGFFLARDALGGDVPFALGGYGNAPELGPGVNAPSTNNWRLLPGQYRSPRYLMRNGHIIDRFATDLRGPPVPDIGFGNNYGGPLWNLGGGAGAGMPAVYNRGYTNFAGWPGQLESWANIGTYWGG